MNPRGRNETALETPPEPVSVEVDGKVHSGTFRSGRGFVMLTSDLGNCFAQRGRSTPLKVAQILLRELAVKAGQASGAA